MSTNTTNPTPGQGTTPNQKESPNTPVVPGPSVPNRKSGDEVPEVDPNTGLPPVEDRGFVPEPDTGVQPDGTMPEDAQQRPGTAKDRPNVNPTDKGPNAR